MFWTALSSPVLVPVLSFGILTPYSCPPSFFLSLSNLQLKYVTEAGAIIVVGALLGGIVMLSTHGEAREWLAHSISPTVFFIGFLPPIIFNSGYTLKRKVFLFYFVPSVLYAVVGTIITTSIIGLSLYGLGKAGLSLNMSLPECLAFGALITSTDTVAILSIFERLQVDPLVFYLCFGESVLSDAVVLVLYKIFTKFIGVEMTWASMGHGCLDFLICLVGSMAVGFLFGCISALVFKHVDLRHTIYEMGVYFLLAYIPSLFSDVISLSGIVTILFTGIFSRHYTHPNLSVNGQARALFLFAFLSVLSETAVFLQLGFSVFSTQLSNLNPSFICWTLLLMLVGRAANIYPLSWVLNRCTSLKVPGNIQHM
jgi:sodium/hydrogen exchanger 8